MYTSNLKHAKEPLVLHAPLPVHFWRQTDQHWQGEKSGEQLWHHYSLLSEVCAAHRYFTHVLPIKLKMLQT